MSVRVGCHHVTYPAPLDVAAVACHVIAPRLFVDGRLALRALRHLTVHVVYDQPASSALPTSSVVVGIPALEARLEAACANCTPIATAARSTDNFFTAWPRTPL